MLVFFLIVKCEFYLSQKTFFEVHSKITNAFNNPVFLLPEDLRPDKSEKLTQEDSLKYIAWENKQREFYKKEIIPVLPELINTTFPDISFVDADFKTYHLSDFKETSLVINYNYPYCTSCMDRISLTANLLKNKNTKIIVLFTEFYSKEIKEMKEYGDNVIFGLINNDTRDLISHGMGDDMMYYLNKDFRITFFDLVSTEDRHEAWKNYLEKGL